MKEQLQRRGHATEVAMTAKANQGGKMDKALQVVLDMIDSLGVQIEYVKLPPDRDGEYIHEERLIRIQHDLSHRPMRSTIAHECAHAVFGDRPSKFGPVEAKRERRADDWAALRLIDVSAYRDAEMLHDGNVEAMAVDLSVTVELVEAFHNLLFRAGSHVYVEPRLGKGSWAEKVIADP